MRQRPKTSYSEQPQLLRGFRTVSAQRSFDVKRLLHLATLKQLSGDKVGLQAINGRWRMIVSRSFPFAGLPCWRFKGRHQTVTFDVVETYALVSPPWTWYAKKGPTREGSCVRVEGTPNPSESDSCDLGEPSFVSFLHQVIPLLPTRTLKQTNGAWNNINITKTGAVYFLF